MAFLYGQNLIEYAIRIGTEDLQKDPVLVNLAFYVDTQKNLGSNLTPSPAQAGVANPTPVFEPLPTDFFQQRLAKIPRTDNETGKLNVFSNTIPTVPDITAYLKTANISVRHGFPRNAQDLPCLAITLGNEEESQKYLGTQKGILAAPVGPPLADGTQPVKKYKLIGSDWGTQYNIHIMSTNHDEVEVWYFILKYCLSAYRPALEAYGMREQSLSFGDIEPASEYLQAGLFVYQRTATLACVKDEDIPLPADGVFNQLGFGVSNITGEGQPSEYPQGNGTIIPDPPPLES